ncbi:hypothetical protein [Thermus scotoductus]|uniref:hypothetical protein n=1 Tax=Thermus scotoductus TaxID=37636 RepID=UPI000690141D|nr:hypothetical protein [Thermus scotoductus]
MKVNPFALKAWRPEEIQILEAGPRGVRALLDGVPLSLVAYGQRSVRLRLGKPGGWGYGILAGAEPVPFAALEAEGPWVRAGLGSMEVSLDLRAPSLGLRWNGKEVLRPSGDGHIRGEPRLPFLARGRGLGRGLRLGPGRAGLWAGGEVWSLEPAGPARHLLERGRPGRERRAEL